MKKSLLLILLLFVTAPSFSQPEFKIAVKDYLWKNIQSRRVELVILLSVKNTGTESGADDDLNHLTLTCSQSNYRYGKDINFVKFNNSIIQPIEPGEEKLGYIVYSVPRDADNLKLKFPENLGGAEKEITMSYVNWAYYNKDESAFILAAHTSFDNGNYADAFVNYLKAYSVNRYLKLDAEVDSTFNMFSQTQEAATYYELFSNFLAEQKQESEEIKESEKVPELEKLKGEVYFCKEYSYGKEVEVNDTYYTGKSGGSLTVMLRLNRKAMISKIYLKIVYEGLLFDINKGKWEYNIDPNSDYFHFDKVYFDGPGTYKVTIYHEDGRKIGSNKLRLIER